MALSRRSFLNAFGAGGVSGAFLSARGFEAAVAEAGGAALDPASLADAEDASAIRIDSNENPVGPSPLAVDALMKGFEFAGRYPTNARPSSSDLKEAIARKISVRPENVVLGAGSRELLRSAVRIYTSSSRHLVTASPSYEQPERMAEQLGVPVRRVPVDAAGRLNLEKMGEAARWGGLLFICNPNNPTGTVHPAKPIAELISRVRKESPETAILIDEAYHDYVGDPGYATALPLALEHPNVFITRTLSKAYGMAGMRTGYAVGQARTIENLAHWAMGFNQSSMGNAAGVAALADSAYLDAERARNAEVRSFTTRFFSQAGFKVMDSQTNFLFVEVGKSAKEFKEACAKQKVLVGREFPPLDKAHARITLGTLDEMKRATAVFAAVLGMDLSAGGANGSASPSGK
jgi:histidinol-phosphate aminotransferase